MNLDRDKLDVPANDYVDALNISRNNKGIPYNILGNTAVSNPYLSEDGVNKRIGSFEDVTRNRLYHFIWNSEGYHLICYYDGVTGTIVKVLQSRTDSDDEDILQFDPSYRINHVDKVYRDEGDLLSWTDGNVSPKEINEGAIGGYGVVEEAFIEAAKRPPLTVPTVAYGDDATKNNNSLRKVLPKFRYRWQYDDFSYSTYSPTSELALPVIVGTDNDLDPTKNNYISVGVETGNKKVIAIEIIAQQLEAGQWSDFFTVINLNKADLSIADDGTYQFNFYNDGVYPNADQDEVDLLFDYVPLKAYTQSQPNGNVKTFGAITEGYDPMNVSDLDVEMTVENVKNTGVSAGEPALNYVQDVWNFNFTVTGAVPTGTYYRVVAFIGPSGPSGILTEYTSLPGDDINDVALALFLDLDPSYQLSQGGNLFVAQLPVGSFIINVLVTPGSGSTSIATESTWNWNSKYRFGLVYFDEQGRTNGVVSFVSQSGGDQDFEVNTPNFSQDGGTPETPVISASINHTPPTWAVKYMWVRAPNLTIANFLYYVTCDFQTDTDYYYFCLENIKYFYDRNDKFNYPAISVAPGDRLKVMNKVAAGVYTSDIYDLDFEIVGLVDRDMTGGASTMGTYVKVKKPLSAPSPAFGQFMFVMVYTPAKVRSNESNFFYEFGQAYDIYEDAGERYHRGQLQDQDAGQPATFEFQTGDIYYHNRSIYGDLEIATPVASNYLLPDANYNDFYPSAINGNGRAEIIDVNARQVFNPTLVRFSYEYQQGTNINGLNRFYPLNYDEYDRSFGIIKKMFIEGRRLFIFQQFETGVVPILTQIVKDTAENPLEANSDILLNKISYPYLGKHGIGDVPESFAYSQGAKYFLDSNKGQAIRLSQDGATVISLVYECNEFFTAQLAAYGNGLDNGIAATGQVYMGNPTVYGSFDVGNDKYILNFEQIRRYSDPSTLVFSQDAVSIAFYESRNPMEGFEAYLSYHSEGMCALNTLFTSFKDGVMWKHNSATRCNFYGVQYEANITPCFNDAPRIKKTFELSSYEANQYWVSGTNGDVRSSQPNPQTGDPQISQLISRDYSIDEGNYYAALWRDANSPGGYLNGDVLKGNWLTIKYRYAGSSEAWLNAPLVGVNQSAKNL